MIVSAVFQSHRGRIAQSLIAHIDSEHPETSQPEMF